MSVHHCPASPCPLCAGETASAGAVAQVAVGWAGSAGAGAGLDAALAAAESALRGGYTERALVLVQRARRLLGAQR